LSSFSNKIRYVSQVQFKSLVTDYGGSVRAAYLRQG